MQRKLCIKLLSETLRGSSLISVKQLSSTPLSKANAKPLYLQWSSRYFSNRSNAHLWKYSGFRAGFSGLVQNGFLRQALSKGRSGFGNDGALWFKSGRFFHSFDSKYRGWRSIFRRLTSDGVVIGLIVTNVAVFMLWRVADPQFMVKNFMISVDNFTSGRVHTLITSAFSHRDMWHLISNMVGLYFFGMSMGRTFGPEYLLKLYLSGALVGSIFYLAYHAFIAPSLQGNQTFVIDPSRIPGLGASGAVNAIMLLDIFLFPTKTLYFDFIIPVPAILLGIFIIGKDVLRIFEGDHQISGSAHLGGATVAAIAWFQSRKRRFRRF